MFYVRWDHCADFLVMASAPYIWSNEDNLCSRNNYKIRTEIRKAAIHKAKCQSFRDKFRLRLLHNN